ncbi:MAG TPA: von Willebrand factor type A domain-containing protein [Flavisolibacter sp.]|nr:von Willebrand factor type A domain-containing protein [Flavisolibacter sp.]
MKHIVNIAVFLFFCPLLAFSQFYMKGQVKDETGNPLQNVTISLHSTGYRYYSGSEGGFGILTSKKEDTITVSLDGYQRQKLAVDATAFVDIKLKRSPSGSSSRFRLASLTQNLKREAQQQWFVGDETYASIIENRFINATTYPTTGLTLNVDRASYSNIRRFLTMNAAVPPDAVRMEEMLNYFNFSYTEPGAGKTFEMNTVLTDCPWNKENQLLFAQVTSKKLALDSLPPSHLVFLIDVSGSMDMPNRLPLLKLGFKALVNNLRPKDSVSIVVYGGVVGVALPTSGGDEKEKILKTIDSLQPGGSTPGESGVKLAYSVARNHFIPKGNNRIILATDGDFNVGLKTDEELEQMIATQREAGIYLTCLGIGMGNYKDSKIQTLAQKGNGNFAYIDNYAEAEKVLLKEFMQTLYIVAEDAYLNVSFDPAYVKEYRLLGFDNKVGAIKDSQATVEGGEIGSAYSSIVAFEIVPTQQGIANAIDAKIYRPVNFTLQYRLPGNTALNQLQASPSVSFMPFNRAPASFRFASSVLMFGGILRQSKFVKDVSWNEVLQIAVSSADQTNYSQKEFISLVEQARQVYGKKRKKSDKSD